MERINKILFGDCREIMRRWAEQGVKAQMCVTSPPYFGLRSYLPDDSPDKPLEIGLEETPEQYVARMVEVFRCVRDVLADDGTLWLNLGDSYGSSGGYTFTGFNERYSGTGVGGKQSAIGKNAAAAGAREYSTGLRPKNLLGIPWRVAFALQADGWYLRQDIIWHKPNPMPESVRDRCTKAHEYIFLLSKSPKYFFDSEALKEPGVIPAGTKGAKGSAERAAQPGVNSRPPEYKVYDGMRNKRSVWTVATRPYKGAHFATFPPALIEPCILAGCPVGGTVLDPFGGAGTTGLVATQAGRNAVLCEINPEYVEMARARIDAASLDARRRIEEAQRQGDLLIA